MTAGGFLDVGVELKNPNFAAMAESMGIKGIRVENRRTCQMLSRKCWRTTPRTARRGQRTSGTGHAANDHARAAKSFGLCALKAVMDGRAAGLIDQFASRSRRQIDYEDDLDA